MNGDDFHPATALLEEIRSALPLVAIFLVDPAGTVRASAPATGGGSSASFENGVVAAASEALIEAGSGLLRAAGEARLEGIFVEGAGTHAFLRPLGEGMVVAIFDPAQSTFGAVRMALRRHGETLALLVQVEAPAPALDRKLLRRFLAKL